MLYDYLFFPLVIDRKMGCSGSKQKNLVTESKCRKQQSENAVSIAETKTTKTTSKSSRQRLNGTARGDDTKLNGWNLLQLH